MDGCKGLEHNSEFNKVMENQRVGGHTSSSSKILFQ